MATLKFFRELDQFLVHRKKKHSTIFQVFKGRVMLEQVALNVKQSHGYLQRLEIIMFSFVT
jgi:hypothetical protein